MGFQRFNPLCDIACNFGELAQFYTNPVAPPIFQGLYDMIWRVKLPKF